MQLSKLDFTLLSYDMLGYSDVIQVIICINIQKRSIGEKSMSLSRRSLIAGCFSLVAATAFSSTAVFARKVFTSSGVAIRGYDPVAYFKVSKPVKGSSSFTTKWNGSTWRFSSQANLDAFKASPAKYAPAYGGYCAWAMSQGRVATTIPQAWDIKGGRLYLNYDLNIRKRWRTNIPKHIKLANAKWPRVSKSL